MCLFQYHLLNVTKDFIFVTDTDVDKPSFLAAKLCPAKIDKTIVKQRGTLPSMELFLESIVEWFCLRTALIHL